MKANYNWLTGGCIRQVPLYSCLCLYGYAILTRWCLTSACRSLLGNGTICEFDFETVSELETHDPCKFVHKGEQQGKGREEWRGRGLERGRGREGMVGREMRRGEGRGGVD